MEKYLRPLLQIAQLIFALFLAYFTIRLAFYHYNLVIFPYPGGLREGAMMTSTDALVKGLNPYDMSLQPKFMNQYGIIYPLLAWPWAKLFGTTILIHRMVSAFSILASCILIFLVLNKAKVPILPNIWAVVMLYASLLFPGTSTPSIDPGGTAMFFFLLTIFIPWFCKYSYPSLAISILCGLLAFYTKSYAFLGALVMLSYLFLFVSKIKGFFYGLLLLTASVISIMTVNHILQAYFDNCIFTHINMEPGWTSMERLHVQTVKYWQLHQWTFMLIGIFILGYGFKNFRLLGALKGVSLRGASAMKQSLSPNEPLIKLYFPLVLYAALCSSFVLYMSLGRHGGAMYWYFFQLLSPFLLAGAAWVFSRYKYWPLVCVPFLILNLHIMTADHDYKLFNRSLTGWPQISALISQHQRILNSPLIAPILIEQHKEVFDNGQAEYFLPGGERISWMKRLFKEDPRVSIQLTLFFYNIRTMVQNKDYDLIILQPSLLPSGVAEDIRKYYKCEGQLLLYAPQDLRPYALTVWVPL